MNIKVIIEKSSDGCFWTCTQNLRCGVVSGNGKTIEEAKQSLRGGLQDLIDMYVEEGKHLPKELQDIEFTYRYEPSAILALFPFNVSALAKEIGVEPSLLRQYKKKETYISNEQKRRIRKAIHNMGVEICRCTE